MKCNNCGAETKGKYCDYCGSELPNDQQMVVTAINDDSKTIINNYYALPRQTATFSDQNNLHVTTSNKSKSIALMLCITLGYLGVHYFYVGKIGIGLLYLLTFGIFGFRWIIDIVRIACGGFKDYSGILIK